ncbi:MAG: DUF6504 family protein [Anaerolineales bacterium]|nr:DUF6504 family protein [Anaerolineales bacterium]
MRAMSIGEPIRILKTSAASYPVEFAWRGRRYYVRTIEGYRSEVERRGTKVRERKRYQLVTADGLRCSVSFDLKRRIWRMESLTGRKGRRA